MRARFLAAVVILLLPMFAAADYLITTSDSLLNNGADYLLITHNSFTSALYPLCRLRDSLGLDVRMAELNLIYSVFDSGPRADRIKSFLRRVYYNWTPRPAYVLLVGDACRDTTHGDYLPSKLFNKFSYYYYGGLTQHAMDNWYAQLEGHDSIPDIIVGRLPVGTLAKAESVVSKIIRYEVTPDTGNWTQTILLAATDDFASLAHDIDTTFFRPSGDSVYSVYESQGSSSFLRRKVRTGFNAGAVLTNSITHGTQPPAWLGVKTLFSYQDVDSLANLDRLTISLGCG